MGLVPAHGVPVEDSHMNLRQSAYKSREQPLNSLN